MITFENAVLVGIAGIVVWAVCSLRGKFESMACAIDKTLDESDKSIRGLIIEGNDIEKEFRYTCLHSQINKLASEVSMYKSADDENRDLRVRVAVLETENKFLKERVEDFESVDADTRFIRYMDKYFIIKQVDYHCDKSDHTCELNSIDICAVEIKKDGVVRD